MHRHESTSVLRWSEAVLGVLTEAGFDQGLIKFLERRGC
jgi:hypothetical protein